MKTIVLKKVYEILLEATAVIIDENALVYPCVAELTGENENEFLYLSWEDDGHDYSLKFREGDNLVADVEGCCLYLFDTDGEEEPTMLTILGPTQLEHTL